MKKRIIITGANGAFGTLAAKALFENGHEVVATMRDPDGRNTQASASLRKAAPASSILTSPMMTVSEKASRRRPLQWAASMFCSTWQVPAPTD